MFSSNRARRESLAIAGMPSEDNAIKTVLRIRPTTGIDNYDDTYIEIHQHESQVLLKPPQARPGAPTELYKFNNVLGPEVNQPEVFKSTARELVQAAFDGQNACLFTYGASGSGKTHTMMGKAKDPGVIPRTLDLVFRAIGGKMEENEQLIPNGSSSIRGATRSELKAHDIAKEEVRQAAKASKKGVRRSIMAVPEEPFSRVEEDGFVLDENATYAIFASFYELYNEKVYDMLAPTPKDKKKVALSVKSDSRGAYVNKLRQIRINSPHEALTVLKAGRLNLSTGSTRLNADSSRSHCLFTLRIAKRVNATSFQVANMAFCDLAGTERGKKLGKASTKLLGESKTINQSLMQLRLVISELQGQQQHSNRVVTFRNSKLTQLMECYLVGYSKTCIIVAVSNDSSIYDDTVLSLKFASTAKSVQLGMDRHGKKLKDSQKMNLSRIASPDEDIEETTGVGEPSGAGTDYSDWSRQDFIEDLEYFMLNTKQLKEGVMNMKVAWQKDEQTWLEEKRHLEEMRQSLRDEVHNARARGHNNLIDVEERFNKRLKERNQTIKELREKLSAGTSEETDKRLKELSDKNDELEHFIIESTKSRTQLEEKYLEAKEFEAKVERSKAREEETAEDANRLRIELAKVKRQFDSQASTYEEERKAWAVDRQRAASVDISPISRSTILPDLTFEILGDCNPLGISEKEELIKENEELIKENEELGEEISNLKNRITMGMEIVKKLKEENSQLTLERQTLLARIEELEGVEQEKNTHLAKSELRLEELSQEKESLQKQVSAFGDYKASSKHEILELTEERQKLMRRIQELEVIELEKNNELSQLKQSLLVRSSAFGEYEATSKDELQELTKERQTFVRRIQQLEDVEQEKNHELAKLKLGFEELTQEKETLQVQLSALGDYEATSKDELQELTKEQETLLQQLQTVEQEKSTQSSVVDSLKLKNQQILEELTEAKMMNSKLTGDLRAAGESVEIFKRDIATTKESLMKHMECKSEYDKQLSERNFKIELQSEKMLELEVELREERISKNHEIAFLSDEMNKLKLSTVDSNKLLGQLEQERLAHREELENVKEAASAHEEITPPAGGGASEADVARLQVQVDDLSEQLNDKVFRSRLRKQLDKEKEQTDQLRKKMATLEAKLVNLEPVEDNITVKNEPLGETQQTNRVKDEPSEDWIPKPATPLQRFKNAITGGRTKHLAPSSPDGLENSPADAPVRRTRRNRK